ncbi:MAG TPA: WD40 repeat domain-containing protein, partial [Thermoanaerobaculia bacterium]|nr:WD40 repeat domain-containing protein [Thermoanaerobaculia bacterium]
RAILEVESLARQALTGNQQSEQTLLIASEAVRLARASHLPVEHLAEYALRQTIARMGGKPIGAQPLLDSHTTTPRRDPFFVSAGSNSGLVSRIRGGALERIGNVPVSVSAISADGRSIASCASEVVVQRDWRRQTAFHVGNDAQGRCALSGDGRWLAFGDFAYDLKADHMAGSGVRLAELWNPDFQFSSDGKWLIASSGQDLWLWSVGASGPERPPRLQIRSDNWAGRIAPPPSSPDNPGVTAASPPEPLPDPSLVPRAVKTGDVYVQQTIDEAVTWSGDGRWLAVASNSAAIVLDLHDPGLRTHVLDMKAESPHRLPAMLFTASSKWLIVNGQTPRAYRAPSFRRGIPIGMLPVTAMAASEDGHWLATATEDVRVWDLRASTPFASPRYLLRGAVSRKETIESLGGAVRSLVFSPNGRWLISASASAELWDLQQPDPTLAPIALTLPDLTKLRFLPNPDSWFLRYWFTPDSRHLILYGAEGLNEDLPTHYALYPLEGDDLLQFASANLHRGFTDAERKWLFPEEPIASAVPAKPQ